MANSHEPYTNREETTNGYSTNVTYINDMPDDSGSGQGTVFSIISKHLIFGQIILDKMWTQHIFGVIKKGISSKQNLQLLIILHKTIVHCQIKSQSHYAYNRRVYF